MNTTTGLICAARAWLWALPALLAVSGLLWWLSRRLARGRLLRFAGERSASAMLALRRGENARFLAWVAALLCLALALARPLTGPRPDKAEGRGADMVIALDVSKSMLVEDVPPNRLAAVKQELGEWLKTLAGDRAGLVVFAGDAFVQAPVTFDYPALNYVLQQVGPQAVTLGGTNIPRAVETAVRLLERQNPEQRFLVIVSDGENLEGDALSAVRAARAEHGLRVFTVGVGTRAGGLVPAQDYSAPAKDGKPPKKYYVSSEYGMQVTSRLDDRALRALAEAGGGRYYEFQPGLQTFPTLLRESLRPLAQADRSLDVNDYFEWFQVPLALAVPLLAALLLFPPRARRDGPLTVGVAVTRPATLSRGRRVAPNVSGKAAALAALLLLSVSVLPAQITDPLAEAERLLAEKQPDKAVEWMRDLALADEKNELMFYNYALTVYRAGRYEEAVKLFQSLEQTTRDPDLLAKLNFQAGNAQVQLGRGLEKRGSLSAAILAYERAAACYAAVRNVRGVRDNKALTMGALEGVLVRSGDEHIKGADYLAERKDWPGEEQRLRNALQAFERAAEINPDNKAVAEKVALLRERLVANLATQAERLAGLADKSLEDSKAAEAQKKDWQVEESVKRRMEAVGKLDQALQVQPENRELENKKREQLEKISDTLTDRAREWAEKPLAKDKLDERDLENLQQARKKLDRAQEANADNQQARELNKQVSDKLGQELLRRGESQLEQAEQNREKNKSHALNLAQSALSNFEKAAETNADSERAKQGIEKAREILPELLAHSAKQDADSAKKELDKGGAATAKDLQKAISQLEKADATIGRAQALDQRGSEAIKQQAGDIRNQLNEARDRLDQKQREDGKSAAEPSADSTEPKGDSESADGEKTSPQLKMQSMQNLRPKPKNPKNEDNFWNRKIRDW